MNTKRTITEIEIALAHSCSFDFRRNIVVFNVNGWSGRYTMRAERYKEPIVCRFYGSKKKHVQAIYPILEWSDENVAEFIKERGIKCHPLYYDEQGNFHVERRLGCVGCPLISKKNRKREFQQHKGMLKAWLLW